MGLTIYFTSGFVAAFYDQPHLNKLLKVAAIGFPLVYIGQVHGVLLQKELRFKTLAIIEIISGVTGAVCTVILAYNNFQELSLIYSQLVFTTLRTSLIIITGKNLFHPIFYCKLREIKEHFHFGIYYLGEGLLGFANGNLENILIGKLIGVKGLGYYTIAYQLAVFPIYRLNPIIMQVTYPIMAKMKEEGGLKRAYLKITDFIASCNFPLLTGLFATAGSLVLLVYGQDWTQSVSIVRIIVFGSFMFCITAPVSSIALSKGKPNLLFFSNLIVLAAKLPIIYFAGKLYGLTGIAWSAVITAAIETVILLYLTKGLVGSFIPELLRILYKPVAFCLTMAFGIALYQYFIGNTGWPHTIAQIILGGIIYIGLTLKYKLPLKEILELKRSL
jgi:PST family polysaccharide transporter/lipopolysaccharide exporter